MLAPLLFVCLFVCLLVHSLCFCCLQGTGMSFKYYDIPMFALTDEKEVTDLVEVEARNCKNSLL